MVAFAASVVECFTGYVSQQNFDSQWISASGKDAFNSVGVGAFFNVMNFGQMLMWHIVLVPIALIAIVGAHVLLVRVRGVSHPLPAARPSLRPRPRAAAAGGARRGRGAVAGPDPPLRHPQGGHHRGGDRAGAHGRAWPPCCPRRTCRRSRSRAWARVAPDDFLATAASELNGTSETATYGPPYNSQDGSVQRLLFSPQTIPGVTQPVERRAGLRARAAGRARARPTRPSPPRWPPTGRRPAAQQLKWANAYADAVTKVTFANGAPVVPAAADGPVPALMADELSLARSGALDADLLAQQPFYGTNFTKPLLFMEDGAYFGNQAQALGLTGSQWGVMNETGSYPGQPWLWLYTLWYQVPGWTNSANIDMIAVYMTGLGTVLLLLVPFIPGLRDIPRLDPRAQAHLAELGRVTAAIRRRTRAG